MDITVMTVIPSSEPRRREPAHDSAPSFPPCLVRAAAVLAVMLGLLATGGLTAAADPDPKRPDPFSEVGPIRPDATWMGPAAEDPIRDPCADQPAHRDGGRHRPDAGRPRRRVRRTRR